MPRSRSILPLLLLAGFVALAWSRRAKDHGIGPGPRPADWLSTTAAEALRNLSQSRKVPEIDWKDVPFSQACEDFSRRTGMLLKIRYDELRKAGFKPERTKVTVKLYNVRYIRALEILLESGSDANVKLGAWPSQDGSHFIVSTQADLLRSTSSIQVYEIGDLLGGAMRLPRPSKRTRATLEQDIELLIRETVLPDLWKDNAASMQMVGDRLVVSQTAEGHRGIANLLDQMREQIPNISP